jgi:hypothetical protein
MYSITKALDSETNPEFIHFFGYAKRYFTEVQSDIHTALVQQYMVNAKVQDVHDPAGLTRSAIRVFIKYSIACEQGHHKKGNPER